MSEHTSAPGVFGPDVDPESGDDRSVQAVAFRLSVRDRDHDVFQVSSFRGREGISRLFRYDLDLVSSTPIDDLDPLIGMQAALEIVSPLSRRVISGIFSRFARMDSHGDLSRYQARLVPRLWTLTKRRDCRIFRNLDERTVIDNVLADAGLPADYLTFQRRNRRSPPLTRAQCTQYRETDFQFLLRLLEETGMFFRFDNKYPVIEADHTERSSEAESWAAHHSDEVFAVDRTFLCPELRQLAVLPRGQWSNEIGTESVTRARWVRTGVPEQQILRDFNFHRPSVRLEEYSGSASLHRCYDYPGDFDTSEIGTERAAVHRRQLCGQRSLLIGEAACPRLMAGRRFAMEAAGGEFPYGEFLVERFVHWGEQPQVLAPEQAGQLPRYSGRFVAVLASDDYLPPRRTRRPTIHGPQTAIVAGLNADGSGEEIVTEEYGQVRVRFHWDRRDRLDESCSALVRVSQAWAGSGYGTFFLPRVGQEVVVQFLDGNPDRPIITGCVYNGYNAIPVDLPAHKTQSVIRTQSSLQAQGFHELRFDDDAGREEIYLHAERKLREMIAGRHETTVTGSQHLRVHEERRVEVGPSDELTVHGDRAETIERDKVVRIGGTRHVRIAHGDHLTLEEGDREVTLERGGHRLEIQQGHDNTEVLQGNSTLLVPEGDRVVLSRQTRVESEWIAFHATQGMSFACGGASIEIDQAGVITINGTLVKIN